MGVFDQAEFDVRFDWGLDGLVTAAGADVVVVVDVLSFSTVVDVAVSRGAIVFPARWKDDRAAAFAESVGAVLAARRDAVSSQVPYSLSPPSFANAPPGVRVVVPSPNGATISVEAVALGAKVIAGCLRNAAAVALAARSFGRRVSVIAAGERWPNGALRPAFEDLVGAGAILAGLARSRSAVLSPEAKAAVAAFHGVEAALATELAGAASGRELIDAGFPDDVAWAARLNASDVAPVLSEGAFQRRESSAS